MDGISFEFNSLLAILYVKEIRMSVLQRFVNVSTMKTCYTQRYNWNNRDVLSYEKHLINQFIKFGNTNWVCQLICLFSF